MARTCGPCPALEAVAEILIALGAHDARVGGTERVRTALWDHVRAIGITTADAPGDPEADSIPHIAFLRRFDLGFRIRRLRGLIRTMNEVTATVEDGARERIEAIKLGLYALLAPFLARAAAEALPSGVATAAARADTDPAAALDALAHTLDLRALDAATDTGFLALLAQAAERPIDILLSTLPDGASRDATRAKAAAMKAILDDEAERLTAISDLIRALRFNLARRSEAAGQSGR